MPRVGTKIKQRNKVKVTRKQKPRRKFKTRFVGDARIQEQWDHRLTTRQNYDKLGLQADPNSYQALKQSIAGAEGALDDEPRLFHVPDSDFLSERNPRRPENYMSEEERKYLRPLIAKHGEDFKAMERDIKSNNMQWTATKLKNRCARLVLVDANVIRAAEAAAAPASS
ncbi:hypothetical protein PybrP1_002234 [[Pythium] brassicae (nom. inval.)]|nr:hypothetical protein PybrP1_002234 [[Pythium] brassicae (nom. inval.)]